MKFVSLSVFAAASLFALAASAQDPSAAAGQEASLAAGFVPDPHTVSITAGGTNDASGLGAGCVGMVASSPDFRLQWGGGPATIKFTASEDTTLVINAPDGSWICADDVNGVNPAISINAPGQYDVFVGSYGGGYPAGTLEVTEY